MEHIRYRTFESFIAETFTTMFGGLLTSTLAAGIVYYTGLYRNIILIYGSIIASLICVLVLSLSVRKLSKSAATILFFVYSALDGVSFSIYPAIYKGGSIVMALGLTASLFLALAFIARSGRFDMRQYGIYLSVGLFGMLFAGILNLFLRSPMMDLVLSWAGITVFIGYTIYDIQMIDNYYYYESTGQIAGASTHAALQLYLDFVNLFVKILHLIGKAKDD